MELKLYADRLSPPSRAVLIFCKPHRLGKLLSHQLADRCKSLLERIPLFASQPTWANGIEFEEVSIELGKLQHRSPEYAEINPMKQVPAIVHGDFKLSESHAIFIYLASAFSGVADHWYPADVHKRAKIHSVLDWHHTLICAVVQAYLPYIALFVSVGYHFNTSIALAFGLPLDPKAAAEGEKLLSASLATIESLWLKGDGPFLLGNSQPSIADLALVCEIIQLEVADEKDRDRIIGKHERVLKWIEDTKNATAPYFDEFSLRHAVGQREA
ncbi:Glutathione S-transferase T1 [Sesamum angolense]|uniref:Glutathione S-transferase T1 n=1 Tax=Sesamum angolense TaxID=2727404 RepID=A0AAE1WWT2_9LAMI|nr:Glutathione S-transferase T1 [Sesamum angolense]